MEFNIKNISVYGFDKAMVASGNPMRTIIKNNTPNENDHNRSVKLGHALSGSGHDNFLKGVIVQFDVTAPLYWWKQAQRYHWFDFVSSQSTMHCLLKFDVKTQCVKETDSRILDIMESLINEYNELKEDDPMKKDKWRTLVASLPCGFCLGATMTTNFQQLKTMYFQRKSHKLKEWKEFCDVVANIPGFKELVL